MEGINKSEVIKDLTQGSEATRGAEQIRTIKSLEIYKAHTAKATEAIKGIPEELRASLGLGWIPNQLVLNNGAYNPNFIDWLEKILTNSVLALSEILSCDEIEDNKDCIQVWKEEAGEIINNVQSSVKEFKDEVYNLSYALEYYNYYKSFIEELGLKNDFEKYVNALWFAKGLAR